jgi:acyl-ACP thioesterase
MGAILDNTAYELQVTVPCFDVDCENRLKISALLRLHQEIGEKHITTFGVTSETLRNDHDLAFIFTKLKVEIINLPKAEEKVTVRTWCSQLKGVRFTRNYLLLSHDGEILTQSKAEVAAIKLSDRSVVRPKDVAVFDCFLYNYDLENECEYPKKLNRIINADFTSERTVRYSDLDYNHHLNNTVYADIVFDLLPPDTHKNKLKSFEINFLNEAKELDTINLSCEKTENTYKAVGTVGDTPCFTAEIEIKTEVL